MNKIYLQSIAASRCDEEYVFAIEKRFFPLDQRTNGQEEREQNKNENDLVVLH